MDSTVIKPCAACRKANIENKFQDEKYGKFNRVFNISEKGSEVCTVCGAGKKK